MLNQLAKKISEANKAKGFTTATDNIGQTLMLVVSEVAEALEADRKGKYANLKEFNHAITPVNFKSHFEELVKDSFEDEIADAIIRLLDLAGAKEIDIQRHIELKLQYNTTRESKHGKRY